MRPIPAVLLLAALACLGCSREPTVPRVGTTAPASQEATLKMGDVTIRASAIQTSTLSEPVAAQYGITRDAGNVMLLVAVRQGAEGQEIALPASVTATMTDLRGQQQTLDMRELRSGAPGAPPEQQLLDYVGTVSTQVPDTLRFDVQVTREGSAPATLQFSREFYP